MTSGRFQGDLPDRTFEFANSILSIVDKLPDGTKGWTVGKQLARSGTSVGANIREADHALTDAEFVYRCSVARREASETEYWLRLSVRAGLLTEEHTGAAIDETRQLLRILTTIVKKSQHAIATPAR